MKTYFQLFLTVLLPILSLGGNVQAMELSESAITELMDSSFAQLNAGKHQEALMGFLKVVEQTKARQSEVEHQVYVCSQTMAVLCLQHLKRYDEAFRLADTVLREDTLSESEKEDLLPLFVRNGYLTALVYMRSSVGRYSDARNLLNKVLPFADDDMRQRIRKYHPRSWYMEGVAYQKLQRFEQALPCMEEALSGYHDAGISNDEMEALCRIGEIKYHLCDWAGSLNAYSDAEKLAVADGDRMQILVEKWKTCAEITDYKALWNISGRMDSLALASESASLQFPYNTFRGKQSEQQGYYAMAEWWYLRNLKLLDELKRSASVQYDNLSDLYVKTCRWQDALRYALQATREFQSDFEATDPDYYLPYSSVANIYQHIGDSVNCFKNIDSLFIAASLTDEPRELYYFYTSRASSFAHFNDFAKALNDYRTADSLLAAKYESTDENRITLLSLMAGMDIHLENYQEAEQLYAKYADVTRSVYGPNSMNYINAVGYLANAEGFAGHIEAATQDYIDAVSMFRQLVRDRWPYMTSAEREGYWSSSVKLLHNMTPFALKANECKSRFTEACYNGLILTKAFLLESERSTYDLIKYKGTSGDLELFTSIQNSKGKIRKWERKGEEYSDSILNTVMKVRQMESVLSERCRVYGDVTAFMDVDYERVRQVLEKEDVLLDFTDFVSNEYGRVYAAYLVKREQDYPLLERLFPEKSIDSLNVRHPYQYYSGFAAERIYNLVWKPFKDNIPEGSVVYYIPSQMLFQIALESIPAGDGTLLGDHYHFIRLSSARELVRYKRNLDVAKVSGHADAVLYGGLCYSLDDATMVRQSKLYNVSGLSAFRGSENLFRGDSLFHDLPGSKDEIEAIDRILNGERFKTIPYSGKEGTEESFLSLDNNSPRILHIATHGFYYTPDAAQKIDFLRGYTDAMSLSGLVFSGGNAAWLGHELPEKVLGGIMTAYDMARMDLSGVEMVVLSACHSGNGKATPEGLYGLQRAFKKAGVKTIVMSLWAESDVVGPEFMALFYENLVSEKWDKHKAFDKAKDAIRSKYPDSPSYWAGFVMLD